MEYWIDGYNIILRRRRGGGASLEDERLLLARSLAALGAGVCIYFDAARSAKEPMPVPELPLCVRFAFAKASTADDMIVETLRRDPDRAAATTVVTDDRELRQRSHQLGARTLGVDKFLKLVEQKNAPASRPAPVRRPESDAAEKGIKNGLSLDANYWLKEMGLDAEWKPDEPDDA